jgi:hypothetical protein
MDQVTTDFMARVENGNRIVQSLYCLVLTAFDRALKDKGQTGWGGKLPVMPALGRLRQKDCEVKANLGYILSSRPAWVNRETLFQYLSPPLHHKNGEKERQIFYYSTYIRYVEWSNSYR